jgi:hypothetical protein
MSATGIASWPMSQIVGAAGVQIIQFSELSDRHFQMYQNLLAFFG